MRETRQYSLYPNDLSPSSAFASLLAHMKRCGYKEDPITCPQVKYVVHLPDSRTLGTRNYTEFVETLSRSPRPERVFAHSHWDTGKTGDLACIVTLSPRSLDVEVESSDLNLVAGTHDTVRQIFRASNPPKERSPLLQRYNLKKSVFLAHRFDDKGNSAAESLGRFLRRLGFDVAEGEGYEAREVPAKVAERISAQDIFLCLATPGDHSWILSEAGFAKGLKKYVIVICEEGVTLNKGILGSDYEYMTYPPGCIEKTYSGLLYALPS